MNQLQITFYHLNIINQLFQRFHIFNTQHPGLHIALYRWVAPPGVSGDPFILSPPASSLWKACVLAPVSCLI